MRFKKNIAFLFGILAFIAYFSFRNLPKNELPVLKVLNQKEVEVYLLKNHLLVPMKVSMQSKNDQEYIKNYLQYVTGQKQLKNANSFDCDDLRLQDVSIKEGCLTLQFNSALFHLKENEELLFLQSIIKMAQQIDTIEQLKIKVNQQQLQQLRYGTIIPTSLKNYQGINSFVCEDAYLHNSDSLIVYRLLQEQGKCYYVPMELRIPAQLTMKEKLQYIVSASMYHNGLKSPFKKNDMIECTDTTINLKMKKLQEDAKLKEQILNIIVLSLEANHFNEIKVEEFQKQTNWTLTAINIAEF
ncbi:MAG: GerMN domain-containing protein [Longicatena sp.]|nr:GerMN domain-containing protein [Longicatena sp.]